MQVQFQTAIAFLAWPRRKNFVLLSAELTQSRLLCAQLAPGSRFIRKKYCGLRGKWVGCHMPLCSSHKPLLPAPTRFWAKQADTRNFIDMPYDGLLPPSSHLQHLTRILRHSILQLLYYHITKKMSNEIFQPSLYLTKLTISLKKLVSPSIPSSKPRHLERSMSANTRHCSTP